MSRSLRSNATGGLRGPCYFAKWVAVKSMSATSNTELVKHLFHAALECEPEERPAFLVGACAGNAAVREEVESLLTLLSDHQDFLESPVFDMSAAEVAAKVL